MAEEVESGQTQKEVESGRETEHRIFEKCGCVFVSNSLSDEDLIISLFSQLLEQKENLKIC
jgi:hypothetical protein